MSMQSTDIPPVVLSYVPSMFAGLHEGSGLGMKPKTYPPIPPSSRNFSLGNILTPRVLVDVSWLKVCEDAFTIKKQTAGQTTTITGGSAKGASDKV